MNESVVDITYGMRGWFCVLYTWNDKGNFYEPWASSPMSYNRPEEAIEEALVWAQNEEVRCAFYGPVYPYEISVIDSVQEIQEGEVE